jgi:zinc protease
MTFDLAMYGKNSPYSSVDSKRSIEKIDQNTLKTWAKHVIAPNGALLTVTGRMTREELHDAIVSQLKGWTQSYPERNEIPAPVYQNKPGVYAVEGNFDQAAVLMGEPGPARMSPDQYALAVFNRYFSRGEFGAILFSEIRSKRGYAYEVDGGFAPGAKGGEYIISLGSRTPEAPNAVEEVLRLVGRSHTETATEERLNEIRRSVTQGFVFNFATPQGAIAREATLKLLHYPADYNETYIPRINAVGRQELLDVSKNHLDPSKFIIVVVGKISPKELSQRFGASYPVYRVKFDMEPEILGRVGGQR